MIMTIVLLWIAGIAVATVAAPIIVDVAGENDYSFGETLCLVVWWPVVAIIVFVRGSYNGFRKLLGDDFDV